MYKLLNTYRSATKREIERAYKYVTDRLINSADLDSKQMLERFKEIDKAFAILTDTFSRSKYDALDTYNFIQNTAWTTHRLEQRDLKKLENLWTKQHINRELERSLNFDKFVPEYDLIWYVPFYQEVYHRKVEQKEAKYTRTRDFISKVFVSFIVTLIIAALIFLVGLGVMVFTASFVVGIFLFVTGSMGLVSSYLLYRQYRALKANVNVVEAKVVDKWIKVLPRLFSKKLRYGFYLAFEFENKLFYQEVGIDTFIKTKTGDTLKVYRLQESESPVFISNKI